MLLVLIFNFIVVATLVRVATRKGLEEALPYFAFFVILAPEETQLKLEGLFDLNTQRIALITLFVLYMALRERAKPIGVPLKHLMLVSVGWFVISSASSLLVTTSMKQFVAQAVQYYLSYYVFVRVISKVSTLERIAFAMVVAIGVCCIFGLAEAYFKWSVLTLFPEQAYEYFEGAGSLYAEMGDRGIRVRSVFPHPILFGDAIAVVVPLAMYLVGICKNAFEKKVLWAAIVLMFWNVYKTSSRGPWVAVCGSLVLLAVLLQNKTRKHILVIAALALSVLIIRPGVWETIFNVYSASVDSATPMGQSYEYRYAVWHSVMQAATKDAGRAMWGHGLGTFRKLGLDVEIPGAPELSHRWYTCDNNWALFLYEIGFVGLLIMVLLLSRPVIVAIRDYREFARPDRYLSGVLFVCLLGFCFLMSSVAAYAWGQPGYMLWVVIAMTMSYSQLKRQEYKQRQLTQVAPSDAAADGMLRDEVVTRRDWFLTSDPAQDDSRERVARTSIA